jgi:hypothetical protein
VELVRSTDTRLFTEQMQRDDYADKRQYEQTHGVGLTLCLVAADVIPFPGLKMKSCLQA